jgi:hypothetical protein
MTAPRERRDTVLDTVRAEPEQFPLTPKAP